MPEREARMEEEPERATMPEREGPEREPRRSRVLHATRDEGAPRVRVQRSQALLLVRVRRLGGERDGEGLHIYA